MFSYQPVNNHQDLLNVVDGLLLEAGLKREDFGGQITFAGMDPIRPTHLKVGCASATVSAANAIASAIIWKHRSGERQDIHIDLRKAYVTQSPWQDLLAGCTLVNGTPQMMGGNVGELGSHILPTRDGRFVILTSLYASNTERIMGLLDSGTLPKQLERATRKWDAADLENAAQDAGVPLVICRTSKEFRATDQYQRHASAPLIHIEKIGDSEPEPFLPGTRPLSGVRVLGMTHVVAGPAVLRQLSAQGADALNLNTLNWIEEPTMYWQTQAGSRQAYMDARVDGNRKAVYELVKGSDVFVENLRPHLADKQGFSAETLASIRPGIIYVKIKLNTSTGPWADWMGYDFTAAALCGELTQYRGPCNDMGHAEHANARERSRSREKRFGLAVANFLNVDKRSAYLTLILLSCAKFLARTADDQWHPCVLRRVLQVRSVPLACCPLKLLGQCAAVQQTHNPFGVRGIERG